MAVGGCVGLSQSLRLAVGGHRSRNRGFVGKFSADLFDGVPDVDQDGHEDEAGRVAIGAADRSVEPRGRPKPRWRQSGGGLAVAVRSLLKRHEGLWFGWSGT